MCDGRKTKCAKYEVTYFSIPFSSASGHNEFLTFAGHKEPRSLLRYYYLIKGKSGLFLGNCVCCWKIIVGR